MEKLELKHLAPYLPYKLKVMGVDTYYEVIGYENENLLFEFGMGKLKSCKPILRPLSDLNKYPHKYESIIDELSIESFGLLPLIVKETLCYSFFEKCFENHFDVFGLIEKGLAINVNELEEV